MDLFNWSMPFHHSAIWARASSPVRPCLTSQHPTTVPVRPTPAQQWTYMVLPAAREESMASRMAVMYLGLSGVFRSTIEWRSWLTVMPKAPGLFLGDPVVGFELVGLSQVDEVVDARFKEPPESFCGAGWVHVAGVLARGEGAGDYPVGVGGGGVHVSKTPY